MRDEFRIDDGMVKQLPLPLAQLLRRGRNAKTALERHQAAFYLWEAAIKLLGSLAVVEYADLFDDVESQDQAIAGRLRNLARPSLGHWWEFIRLLVPLLAERNVTGFAEAAEFLFSRTVRDDLPRTAGLDVVLQNTLEATSVTRSVVRPAELFERIVQYRNRELGHGALGRKTGDHYERISRAFLPAAAEFFSRFDLLTGRQLVFLEDVRRRTSGDWELECYLLAGESGERLSPAVIPQSRQAELPKPGQLYGCPIGGIGQFSGCVCLHPLVLFDPEANDALFMNARRGKSRVEYLSYVSGDAVIEDELVVGHQNLLAKVLDIPVTEPDAAAWATQAQQESQVDGEADGEGESESALADRWVGDFQIVGKIGVGGMGDVYRAWQPTLGRQVALKCMRRKGDPRVEMRFAREIRALGRVEHPHLVKIFTSGSEADRWFYAMELVEGAPLSQLLKHLLGGEEAIDQIDEAAWKQALDAAWNAAHDREMSLTEAEGLSSDGATVIGHPTAASGTSVPGRFITYRVDEKDAQDSYVSRVVEIVRQVSEAAHALHAAGIVHRDIKPENIMITPDGENAILMDLGLAKLMDDEEHSPSQTREFLGTLRYASPEQVLSAKHVDRRSDIYSLGVILWELLALRPIYNISSETPLPELMQRVQSADPDPVRKSQPRVPVELEAIAARCLQKNKKSRYQTSLELADDLLRWQKGEVVTAKPPGPMKRFGRMIRRHRWPVAGLGILLLAAMAVGFILRNRGGLTNAEIEQIEREISIVRRAQPMVLKEPNPTRRSGPKLKPESYGGFDILDDYFIWDLRHSVRGSKVAGSKRVLYPASLLRRLRLRKTDSAAGELRLDYETSGPEVYMRCLSHPQQTYVLVDPRPHDVGGAIMKRRQMVVDLKSVPEFEEFNVRTCTTFWTPMEDKDTFLGAVGYKQTFKISQLVLFPKERPFTGFQLLVVVPNGDGTTRVEPFAGKPRILVDEDKQYIYWEVVDPKPGYVYRIDWEW